MSRLPLKPVHWLCFLAWEPGDTVLEMLKGENPGSLAFCVPYLYSKRWKVSMFAFWKKKLICFLNAVGGKHDDLILKPSPCPKSP